MIEIIEWHGVPLEQFDFDDRFGMLSAAQEFVDAHRRTLAVANAVDNEARSEDAIAARKDAGRRGHQRLRIHCDQAAR